MKIALKRWLPWLIAALLVAGGLAFAFRPQPVPVDMETVRRGPLLVTVSGSGQMRVADVYTISAPVQGQLARIETRAGDPVFASETVVARIREADPAPLDARTRAAREAQLKAAQAALVLSRAERDRAKAELDFARLQLDRSRELAGRGTISQAALDRAETEFRAHEAAHETAVANVSVRLADVEQARAALIQPDAAPAARRGAACCVEVRSPVSGQVLRVLQESEAVVQAGAPLLEIGSSQDLEVVVDLLSTDAVRVSAGDRVLIENWGGSGMLEGRVARVEPYAFTKVSALGVEEQRVNVRIATDAGKAAEAGLGHGYRVETRIVIADLENVLRVPVSALYRDGGDWSVFVVAEGTARERGITVGRMNDTHAEILSGLAAGDSVIVYPGDRIEAGTRVVARD